MSPQTARLRECRREGCQARFDDLFWSASWPRAFCSMECYRLAKPKPAGKGSQAVSTASPEQAAKRRRGASIVSGETYGLDASHLTPRGLGGCDDPLCIVPLTRGEHRAFDAGELDLLPFLVAHRCFDEMAHCLHHYRGDLPAMLERLTGVRWAPQSRQEEA